MTYIHIAYVENQVVNKVYSVKMFGYSNKVKCEWYKMAVLLRGFFVFVLSFPRFCCYFNSSLCVRNVFIDILNPCMLHHLCCPRGGGSFPLVQF